MARYRKVDVRMWSDAKFRSLSAAPPNAQTLWVYLLTNPETTSIPGLFRAGEAAIAEALGWDVKGFREPFQELFRKGLAKADWKARLVWIPNALKHNPPENPNVVKGWRAAWDELPECSLKSEAHQHITETLKGFGKGLLEPFAKGCPNRMPNQEQEQEQEQDQKLLSADADQHPASPENSKPEKPKRPPRQPSPQERLATELCEARSAAIPGVEPDTSLGVPSTAEWCKAINRQLGPLLTDPGADVVRRAWGLFLADAKWARTLTPPCPLTAFLSAKKLPALLQAAKLAVASTAPSKPTRWQPDQRDYYDLQAVTDGAIPSGEWRREVDACEDMKAKSAASTEDLADVRRRFAAYRVHFGLPPRAEVAGA